MKLNWKRATIGLTALYSSTLTLLFLLAAGIDSAPFSEDLKILSDTCCILGAILIFLYFSYGSGVVYKWSTKKDKLNEY